MRPRIDARDWAGKKHGLSCLSPGSHCPPAWGRKGVRTKGVAVLRSKYSLKGVYYSAYALSPGTRVNRAGAKSCRV